MSYFCPGQSERNLKAQTGRCPQCGWKVEIFSDEHSVKCPSCGRILLREEIF
ncbi:hypothetical protein H5U35_08980 [Candidatus Aerophobetes bacterium]|nr:hypothetical protein [Candidatus Aerophobetes bacterium]